MKKLFTLFMLLCMGCMGAWADYTDVESLPTTLEGSKQAFMLVTRPLSPRGTLYAGESDNYLRSTAKNTSKEESTSNSEFQFLLLKAEGTNAYYIYSVAAKKFFGAKSGVNVTLVDNNPTVYYIWKSSQKTGYSWTIGLKNNTLNNNTYPTINVTNWSNDYGLRFTGTSSYDDGNEFCIANAETVSDAVLSEAYAKAYPNSVSEYQTKIDAALSHSGQVGYPTDMSSLNQYATNGVTNQNVTAAITAYDAVYNSTDIKLPEAGHVYSIMAYFKGNQSSARYVTNATGTTISAPTTLATDGTAYWLYTNSKFQNKANAANYLAGAENTEMSVNTSGTAFTMVKGLEFGTICIKGGQSHHAINTDGAFGRFTGEDKRQNSGTGYTTDFMITEVAYYVNPSTGSNPIYYTIKNKNQNRNKYVTASLYGADNMLTQETNASAGSYWYFEDASSDIQVDGSKYQPIYIRNAKLGGYLTTDKNVNASETVTKDAEHKEVFYLRLWDNGANTNGYVVVSRTAAKTTGTTNDERNSWSDSSGQGASIDYWKSQDAGTPFLIERVSTDITSTIAAELTDFATGDYVGDYIAEEIPNTVSAREAYQAEQTAEHLYALRDAYTQEFYWADGPARRTISTDKFYVIENAKNTKKAIYQQQSGSYKFLYDTFQENDARFVFRFADKSTEVSSNWGNTSKTYDTFRIYCVGSTQKGYINWGAWNSDVTCGNSSDVYRFKIAEVEPSGYQLSAKSSNDNFTISTHGSDNTTLADNANGNLRSWNKYTNAYTNVWKLREVKAPVLEKQAVSISGVGVATFYTGKTLEIPEGVTAKKVVDAENAQQGDVYHLVYEELQDDEIPAGTPVVLFGEQSTYQFPRSLEPHDYVVTSVAGSAENRLIGTLNDNDEATGFGENGTLYALGNKNGLVAFYHFLGETLTAGKAYLDARDINNTAGGGSVRAFAIFDEGTGTITCIDALTGATIDKGTAFDLAGRRINAQAKGISIVNGKKVIR